MGDTKLEELGIKGGATVQDVTTNTAVEQSADTRLEQVNDIVVEQAVDRTLKHSEVTMPDKHTDMALEQATDRTTELATNTAQEQAADITPEQGADTMTEQAADIPPEQTMNTSLEEDGVQEQGLGQIDVASRNAEIYRKYKEGYIHAQLSKEYSLSPEWIRRICEDEERKRQLPAPRQVHELQQKDITVRDICNLCEEDCTPVMICNLKNGVKRIVFEGNANEAARSVYRDKEVQSLGLADGRIQLNSK